MHAGTHRHPPGRHRRLVHGSPYPRIAHTMSSIPASSRPWGAAPTSRQEEPFLRGFAVASTLGASSLRTLISTLPRSALETGQRSAACPTICSNSAASSPGTCARTVSSTVVIRGAPSTSSSVQAALTATRSQPAGSRPNGSIYGGAATRTRRPAPRRDIANRLQPLMATITRVSATMSPGEKVCSIERLVDGIGRALIRDQVRSSHQAKAARSHASARGPAPGGEQVQALLRRRGRERRWSSCRGSRRSH
jgi:hypothetical protein